MRLAAPYIYVPFTVTGVAPWHGKYFNNDEHASGVWRRTTNPSEQCQRQQPRISVWVFGGSTIYGTGVPDSATIPSYLSRDLNRDWQKCVEVTNFGNESFVTNQEVMLLQQQLKHGGIPDIVIFYDGFNDSHIGMTAADPSATHYGIEIIKARVEGSFRGRFDFVRQLYSVRLLEAVRQLSVRARAAPIDEKMRASAARVLDNYEANHQLANALRQTYGFKFYGFWQPMLFYGNKPLDSFEKQIQQLDNSNKRRFDPRPVAIAYKEADRRAPAASFVFLANLFDSVSEPLYIDEAHLGPRGNELVAAAIAKCVEDHPDGNRSVDNNITRKR
ncbi:MAG TPA: SGNH/GDSL hydrolase family protein [Candidatus Solibacter sp.]|nr:SGNH/GDSL hydrolase family protein [Candidatus Solibacter sp.]